MTARTAASRRGARTSPRPRRASARGRGVGDVRLRQLGLHDGRHHRGLQRVLRRAWSPATRRGRRFAWTLTLAVSYCRGDGHRAGRRRLRRLRAREEAAARRSRRSAASSCTAALALGRGRATWRSTCVLVVASNFFFSTGENLIAAFLPELAAGKALGKVSGWGWGLGYHRRPRLARREPRLRDRGPGARRDRRPVRAGDDADHRGDLPLASLPTLVWLRERGRAAAAPRPRRRRRSVRAPAPNRRRARAPVPGSRPVSRLPRLLSGRRAGGRRAGRDLRRSRRWASRRSDTITLILVGQRRPRRSARSLSARCRTGSATSARSRSRSSAGSRRSAIAWWRDRPSRRSGSAANLAGLCLGASQSGGRALVGYLTPAATGAPSSSGCGGSR